MVADIQEICGNFPAAVKFEGTYDLYHKPIVAETEECSILPGIDGLLSIVHHVLDRKISPLVHRSHSGVVSRGDKPGYGVRKEYGVKLVFGEILPEGPLHLQFRDALHVFGDVVKIFRELGRIATVVIQYQRPVLDELATYVNSLLEGIPYGPCPVLYGV